MNDYRIRCSSLGTLMTNARSIDPDLVTDEVAAIQAKKTRTDEEKALLAELLEASLSATAKTHLCTVAKEYVYGFHEVVTGKYMDKGLLVENEAIALYNERFFTSYSKNTERRDNGFITGECDIYVPAKKIIDTKSCWSWATFPATASEGEDSDYEWQLRGYMWLWDVDEAEIAYCMVDTPPELLRDYDQAELHQAEHIDASLRVTIVPYLRDRAQEQRIVRKVTAARMFLDAQVKRIYSEHS